MFLIKFTETLDHDIDDIDTVIHLYQTHERLITENLLQQVVPSFKKINFFEKSCPNDISLDDFIRKAIPYFRFEEHSFGDILYNCGDQVDKMYIILDGSAMEFTPRKGNQLIICNTPVSATHKRQAKQMSIWELVMQMHYFNPKYWKNGQRLLQYQETFKIGQHFGDLSTEERSKGAIIASSQLLCISLKRQEYKLLFGRELPQTRKNLDYFKNLITGVSENKLLQFINQTQYVTYIPKQLLWQKGDEAQFMFFLVEGVVEIYKYKFVNIGKSVFRREKIAFRQQSAGCLVGADEIMQKKQFREYNCSCVSKVEGFQIKSDQIPFLSQKFQEIYRQLCCLSQKNIQFIEERKKDIDYNIKSQTAQVQNSQNNQQLDTEFNNEYYCSPRQRQKLQIRSSLKDSLTFQDLVQKNQILSKSTCQNSPNTIYPIENQEHFEIMMRFHPPQNQPIETKSQISFKKCFQKIHKKLTTKKYNSTKKFQLSPQILIKHIENAQMRSHPVSPTVVPLDNTYLKKKLRSRQENQSQNKSTTTQIFTARQSMIDQEPNFMDDSKSQALYQQLFSVSKVLFSERSRGARLLSQQAENKK